MKYDEVIRLINDPSTPTIKLDITGLINIDGMYMPLQLTLDREFAAGIILSAAKYFQDSAEVDPMELDFNVVAKDDGLVLNLFDLDDEDEGSFMDTITSDSVLH